MPDTSYKRLNRRVCDRIVLPFNKVSLDGVVEREAGEGRTRSYLQHVGIEILK